MHTMPKEIEFVADKILKNKVLYDEVKNMLKNAVIKLNNDSLGHSSFCSVLRTPAGLPNKLIKIFGISDRQMLDAFKEIGFHPDSRMYSSLYYQTLCLVYYVGILSDDDLLRVYSTALIYVKIFNGRQYRYMPNGCQEEVAQYLIQNVFRKSKIFSRYPNPFTAITQYLAPSLDTTYKSYIKKDAAHPVNGLTKLLSQSWNRVDQMFMGIQKQYYEAHDKGNKLSAMTSSDGSGREVDASNISKISKTITKMQKDMISHAPKLNDTDTKYLKDMYSIGNVFLNKSKEFLDSDLAEDDLKNVYEMIFTIADLNEHKMLTMNVVSTVSQLTSSKGNNIKIQKLKGYIDNLLSQMFKGIMKSGSSSSKLKLRKVLMLIIVLRAKKMFTKASFEKNF